MYWFWYNFDSGLCDFYKRVVLFFSVTKLLTPLKCLKNKTRIEKLKKKRKEKEGKKERKKKRRKYL